MQASRTIWFCLVLLVAGCSRGEGPPRFRVQGEVTFQGRPVPFGRILFEPDTTQGNAGPQGFALIERGRYDTSKQGQGLVGGPHLVIIHGFDGNSLNDDAPFGQALFAPYQELRDFPRAATSQNFAIAAPEG